MSSGTTFLLLVSTLAGCSGSSPAGGTGSSGGAGSSAGSTGGAADGGTLYHCTVDGFRTGGNGGTPVCPTDGCSSPTGNFCDTFDLIVDGTSVTWVGCFTCSAVQSSVGFVSCSASACRTPALTCTPTGHVTDPPDASFAVSAQMPYCGAELLGSNELWVGYVGTWNALCVADGTAPSPDAGVNACN